MTALEAEGSPTRTAGQTSSRRGQPDDVRKAPRGPITSRRQRTGRTRGRWNTAGDRGSTSIEIVLLTPALVACILVIAVGARYVDARGQTSRAAFAAARAASLTNNQDSAVAAGRAAASRALAERGQACTDLTVVIDADDFTPSGNVHATVTCVADLGDVTGLGLPGHRAFTATATVPIDQYRDLP